MKNETNQSSWIRSVNPFFPKLTLAAVTDECIRKVKRYIIPLRNNMIWFQVIHLRTDCKVYNMMADNESEATGCLVISSTSVCIKYCTILLLLVFWWWMLMSTAFDRHAVLLKSARQQATASKSLVWRIFSTIYPPLFQTKMLIDLISLPSQPICTVSCVSVNKRLVASLIHTYHCYLSSPAVSCFVSAVYWYWQKDTRGVSIFWVSSQSRFIFCSWGVHEWCKVHIWKISRFVRFCFSLGSVTLQVNKISICTGLCAC